MWRRSSSSMREWRRRSVFPASFTPFHFFLHFESSCELVSCSMDLFSVVPSFTRSIWRTFFNVPSVCRTPIPDGSPPAQNTTATSLSVGPRILSAVPFNTQLAPDGFTVINTFRWTVPGVRVSLLCVFSFPHTCSWWEKGRK